MEKNNQPMSLGDQMMFNHQLFIIGKKVLDHSHAFQADDVQNFVNLIAKLQNQINNLPKC